MYRAFGAILIGGSGQSPEDEEVNCAYIWGKKIEVEATASVKALR